VQFLQTICNTALERGLQLFHLRLSGQPHILSGNIKRILIKLGIGGLSNLVWC